MFVISDHTILEGATNEYMKQLFTLAASNILDSPTGMDFKPFIIDICIIDK
jgi:hypothetical protein